MSWTSLTSGAVALGLSLGLSAGLLSVGGTALAAPPTDRPAGGPVVTRAALDPALVAGRGARVGFAEQEAENAATNGTVIGPDRTAYTLPSEASTRTSGSPATAVSTARTTRSCWSATTR